MKRLGLVIAAAFLLLPGAAQARVKWLCAPAKQDVCDVDLATTEFSPLGERLGERRDERGRRRIDCFYVYPTVSDQTTTYANKRIDPEIRSIALFQAARFSEVCRVFAPVYRQRTVPSLASGRPEGDDVAQADIREAWRTYLRRHNRGRGVVLIGHSQGTFRLRRLIKSDIDDGRAVQRRIVSALLLGGNAVEGEFNGFLPCRTARQLGCVVAYSIYDETPPPDALFGRSPDGKVLCTNPARLLGGPATIDTVYPTEPFAPGTLIAAGIQLLGVTQPTARTRWISVRDGYRAQCRRRAGATYLEVRPVAGAPDFTPSPTPQWGLHLTDGNLPLGDLVALVKRQAAVYAASRR